MDQLQRRELYLLTVTTSNEVQNGNEQTVELQPARAAAHEQVRAAGGRGRVREKHGGEEAARGGGEGGRKKNCLMKPFGITPKTRVRA